LYYEEISIAYIINQTAIFLALHYRVGNLLCP